jgi:hypothetical protein
MPPTQVRRQDGASYLYLGSTAAVSPVWRLVRVGSALSRPSSPQSRPDKRSSTLGPRGPRQRSGTVARLSPTLARMSTCSGDLLKGRLFLLFFFENFFWTHLSCLWNPVRVTWPGSPADSQRGCTGDPHGCRGRPALGQITGCRRAWGVGRASRGIWRSVRGSWAGFTVWRRCWLSSRQVTALTAVAFIQSQHAWPSRCDLSVSRYAHIRFRGRLLRGHSASPPGGRAN